jgi:hypothetical protein
MRPIPRLKRRFRGGGRLHASPTWPPGEQLRREGGQRHEGGARAKGTPRKGRRDSHPRVVMTVPSEILNGCGLAPVSRPAGRHHRTGLRRGFRRRRRLRRRLSGRARRRLRRGAGRCAGGSAGGRGGRGAGGLCAGGPGGLRRRGLPASSSRRGNQKKRRKTEGLFHTSSLLRATPWGTQRRPAGRGSLCLPGKPFPKTPPVRFFIGREADRLRPKFSRLPGYRSRSRVSGIGKTGRTGKGRKV